MQKFIRHCRIAAFASWLLGFLAAIAFLALNDRPAENDVSQLARTALAVWCIYPALILSVIYLKTGLTWHLLNAHPTWHALLFMVALIHGLYWLGTTEIRQPANWIIGGVGLMFMLGLEVTTRQRAQVQRQQYGDRWQQLAQTAFVDILLLRTPRAKIGAA